MSCIQPRPQRHLPLLIRAEQNGGLDLQQQDLREAAPPEKPISRSNTPADIAQSRASRQLAAEVLGCWLPT